MGFLGFGGGRKDSAESHMRIRLKEIKNFLEERSKWIKPYEAYEKATQEAHEVYKQIGDIMDQLKVMVDGDRKRFPHKEKKIIHKHADIALINPYLCLKDAVKPGVGPRPAKDIRRAANDVGKAIKKLKKYEEFIDELEKKQKEEQEELKKAA